ncbi:MAG TPA: PH domain-containing protein [Gemmatimonadaceae bacterium]|nr:PH domain-containing protein [Gemmatimonadaceae bacterium]
MESFAIVPGPARGLWGFFALILLILLIVAAVLLATVRGARLSRFELSDAGLRLRGDLYGRLIPSDSLRGGAARIVDLANTPDLQPRWRTMGTAFPGYRAGWFRLRNGERALVYLTETSRTIYLPTRAGYSVMLTPQQPERFLERLRTVAPSE